MNNLKKAFRDNIVAPYTKYNLSNDNIGEVIEADADRNICTVTYKNIDGISVTKSNVPVKNLPIKGILKGFPKVGEYVELQETTAGVRITGIASKKQISESNEETSDVYSGIADFLGFLGL